MAPAVPWKQTTRPQELPQLLAAGLLSRTGRPETTTATFTATQRRRDSEGGVSHTSFLKVSETGFIYKGNDSFLRLKDSGKHAHV